MSTPNREPVGVLGPVDDQRRRSATDPWHASAKRGTGRGWSVVGLFFVLAFLPSTVWEIARSDRAVWLKTLLIVGLVGYGAAYLCIPYLSRRFSTTGHVVMCVGLLALGCALVFGIGLSTTALLVYATALTAMMLPVGLVLALDGGVVLVFAVAMAITGDLAEDWGSLVTLISVSMCVGFIGQLTRTVRELRAARDEIATLAAADERSRMARDLHDLLGHSLTTITVKAGLARRVLESSQDVDRALAEVREVEELSRQATQDVRATVSGYREVVLSAELVGARAALRAAQVTADLPHAVDTVRPDLRGAFGYVLREAVTNVLRHSGATRCEVRLGPTWLEIRDNGNGCPATPHPGGNGLTGLRERLTELGGTLEAGPLPAGGFRLAATVPATPPAAVS
ncbi:sensor histidine kinase [Actinokineospora enzanensis]|uniref:sensor histidine kinase n=1 Tax=Actinokineospora enzanensis TaxID=155975 RepID=UPI0003783FAF|nr:sensor histidine kinase [Actinokineospora enzanensis]